ncbi:MAG: RDD family protein [Sphingobacteriales bacterium]|nr:MAG: RDD family protein [Sphingobacteriales bacterium]
MEIENYSSVEEYNPDALVLPEANNGLRFANMLVDNITYWLVLVVITFILAIIARLLQSDAMNFMVQKDLGSKALAYLYSYAGVLVLRTATEGIFKGRTLGKLITGTKAVTINGDTITWEHAFKRALCRLIPFEAFSAFSDNGLWHDRLSKTKVVVVR